MDAKKTTLQKRLDVTEIINLGQRTDLQLIKRKMHLSLNIKLVCKIPTTRC